MHFKSALPHSPKLNGSWLCQKMNDVKGGGISSGLPCDEEVVVLPVQVSGERLASAAAKCVDAKRCNLG
jgi:hypothetical protein